MYDATTAAGCAEIRKHHKMRYFAHLSETGDSPDTLIFYFYFQHNENEKVNVVVSELENHYG